jgi:phasin family protein
MADETSVKAEAAAPVEAAATVTATAEKAVEAATVKPAKAPRAAKVAPARKASRKAKTTKTKARRSAAKPRTARSAQPKAAFAANERNSTMNFDPNNWFASFNAVPTATPFQTLFADAGERGQDAVAKSQKVAGELAELTRDNVEALTEAGRIAAEGARSIGQDLVASTRAGVEKAADSVRALAEAKSPTEYMQIHSDLARASFDRMVTETSRLTESAVKLAGEAFQPLSNRASIAADKLNTITA